MLVACLVEPSMAAAQTLTGALIGTVKDPRGGLVPGARVGVSSPALIGGPVTQITNAKGQWRFPALPPGAYELDIQLQGFAPYREGDIRLGAGATIERTAVLQLEGVVESVVVEGAGSHLDARDPGLGTRFGRDDIKAIPTRRASMFDFVRAAPGISPTAPASGTETTVSAFGSGTNENQFLFDGTNFTCPCNGVARAEPGVDFIQEIHVQSIGASAEYGNVQGAVINVISRQGGERFQFDTAYYGQTSALTAQPRRLPIPGSGQDESGYERALYRDVTASLGGPVVRDRLWFFAGYQHLRDYDSQPGTNPAFPRTDEQDKIFGKLTWRFSPAWQLTQSVHDERWVSPQRPTIVTPAEATTQTRGSVPAITFGHLTHTLSANTLWDVRVGRFVYALENPPTHGDRTVASRFDRLTGVTSGAPRQFGETTIRRTTAKATLSHYRPDWLGADHQWKVGAQVEQGDHHGTSIVPTGVRYVDNGGLPFQAIASAPSTSGGLLVTASAFASDAVTVGDRLTISAGLRFDHSRAESQDLAAIDLDGHETGGVVGGLGALYTWNILSPRLGVTARLTGDGKTMLRASYGRFSQGVLTGELSPFHPGAATVATSAFEASTGGYTRVVSVVDPGSNLQLDAHTRAPRTDEYSVGVDRELGRRLAVSVAYVRKDGGNFIGWTDIGGQYVEQVRTLPDGRALPVAVLVNGTGARRFFLTNPDDYSLSYNGLVVVAEKRRSQGWQAFGSYTFSRAAGLQPSSGTTAAGAQVSTIGPPNPLTFGRDPNDLTNARGRLPNDRPHIFRVMGTVDVPGIDVVVAGNLQYFSGKPWAATAQVLLPQGDLRVLLERRGTQRLPAQTLLDVRVSKTISLGGQVRVDLLLDVLNALNDASVESLATDNFFSTNYGQPTAFVDPRRVMLGVRVNLGR
jgi:hypothetical protein